MQETTKRIAKLIGASTAGGLAALTAFAAPVENAELFHVTRRRDAASIASEGLRRFASTPSASMAEEAAGGGPMMETPNSDLAERDLQELLNHAYRETPAEDMYPNHEGAVFFWPSRSAAEIAVENNNFANTIVGVDPDLMSGRCNFAAADTSIPDAIFGAYWDRARGRGQVDEDALFEDAKRFWTEAVVAYPSDQVKSAYEVWTNCDVPPEAITHIEDAASGRVIERPIEADQSTLDQFP